jgi:predicted acetyltransferase
LCGVVPSLSSWGILPPLPKHPVTQAARRIVMSTFMLTPLRRRARYAPPKACACAVLRYSGPRLQRASVTVLRDKLKMEQQSSVSVVGAERAQAPIIQNLIQLYTHDFSGFWGGTSRGDLNAQGLFESYPLDDYWSLPNWSAMLIWCDRALAGFCLINDRTHSGLQAQRNMAEFFILRKHRGRGVGRFAAEIIFSQHPGLWEVAVARKNAPAREFWRKTIKRSAKSSRFQELDLRDERWNGPIFRFEWSI